MCGFILGTLNLLKMHICVSVQKRLMWSFIDENNILHIIYEKQLSKSNLYQKHLTFLLLSFKKLQICYFKPGAVNDGFDAN